MSTAASWLITPNICEYRFSSYIGTKAVVYCTCHASLILSALLCSLLSGVASVSDSCCNNLFPTRPALHISWRPFLDGNPSCCVLRAGGGGDVLLNTYPSGVCRAPYR